MNAQKQTCDQCGKETADHKKESGWARIVSGPVFTVSFSSGDKGVTSKRAKGPLDLCSKECREKFFTAPEPVSAPVKTAKTTQSKLP